MNYGRAIRTCRVAFGLQQRELAELAEIDPSHLSLVEAGKRNPSLATVEALVRALGVPVHLLTLLASEPSDLKRRPGREVEMLSRALLDLLVSARVRVKTDRRARGRIRR